MSRVRRQCGWCSGYDTPKNCPGGKSCVDELLRQPFVELQCWFKVDSTIQRWPPLPDDRHYPMTEWNSQWVGARCKLCDGLLEAGDYVSIPAHVVCVAQWGEGEPVRVRRYKRTPEQIERVAKRWGTGSLRALCTKDLEIGGPCVCDDCVLCRVNKTTL